MACFSCCTLLSISIAAVLNFEFSQACTSFAVGRLATKHGSTIVSQNMDNSNVDARAVFIPPSGPHPPGTLTPIYQANCFYPRFVGVRSPTYEEPNVMVTPTGTESTPVGPKGPWPRILGYIPQANYTYGYWEGSYGFLNEHGLALAEYTTPAVLGPLPGVPQTGKMSSIAVSRFVMERCKTARCAVQLAGSLFEQYGLAGEDPGTLGAGESLSIADGVEAWIFHVTGGMNFNASSIWAAQRVPDDHVAMGSQGFIIRGLDFDDHDHHNFFWSPEILSRITEDPRILRKKPECSNEPLKFDFQVCYGEDWRTLDLSWIKMSYHPSPQYVTLRMWYAHNWLAPSLKLNFTLDARYYNFSLKPDWLLDRKDIMHIMGNHFEGSPFDMRYGVAAGPHGDPGRAIGGPFAEEAKASYPERPFALKRTSHGVIVETNVNWPVKAIGWFAADSPDTSVYVPFFAGTQTRGPYSVSGHQQFRWDSAYSVFNFLNNYASLWWDNITEQAIYPMRDQVQDYVIKTCESLLARAAAGASVDWNDEQLQMQEFVVARWRNLTNYILTTYTDHVIYGWVNGTFDDTLIGYPAWWLDLIGSDYRPVWVERADEVQPAVHLPQWLQRGSHAAADSSMAVSASSNGEFERTMAFIALVLSWALGVATVLLVQWLGFGRKSDTSQYKPLLEQL